MRALGVKGTDKGIERGRSFVSGSNIGLQTGTGLGWVGLYHEKVYSLVGVE